MGHIVEQALIIKLGMVDLLVHVFGPSWVIISDDTGCRIDTHTQRILLDMKQAENAHDYVCVRISNYNKTFVNL